MTTASNAPQKCSKVPTGSLEWATGEQPEQLYVDRLTIMITKVLGPAFLLTGLLLGVLIVVFPGSGYLPVLVLSVCLLLVIGDVLFSSLELEWQAGSLLLRVDGIDVRYSSPGPTRNPWAHSKLFRIPLPVSKGGFASWNAMLVVVGLPIPTERKTNTGKLRFRLIGGNTGGSTHTFDVMLMLDTKHGAQLLDKLVDKGVRVYVHKVAWSMLKEGDSTMEPNMSPTGRWTVRIN